MEDNRSNVHFLSLAWQDVIFSHIFCYLPLTDIVKIRRTSQTFNELCLTFFKCFHALDFSAASSRLPETAFALLTKETCFLKCLNLENCKSFKDDTLSDILMRNANLSSLNINGCNSLSNRSLCTTAEFCSNLNRIYLKECRWVSEKGIVRLAAACKMLNVVDLSGCWEVNDNCIITLVTSCPTITQLSVNGCYGITDTSMHVLSRCLPELTVLELDGCWRVSNDAITLIGEYCSKLQGLNVKDCRDISEASLGRLRVKGVRINKEPEVPSSRILAEYIYRPDILMLPLRFDPT